MSTEKLKVKEEESLASLLPDLAKSSSGKKILMPLKVIRLKQRN